MISSQLQQSSLLLLPTGIGRAVGLKCKSIGILPAPRWIRYSKSSDHAIFDSVRKSRRRSPHIVANSASDAWSSPSSSPYKEAAAPAATACISDVLWPTAGAFLSMALLGRLDQIMAPKLGSVSFTIAPLGAVCAVLFATPNSPAAQKQNMFVAQIICAALGVLALSIFGPGWLARSTAVAASIAFMIITRATHPPAASLPILFIDGARFHQLHFWYMLFPGAASCIILCLIQELVSYLKSNCKF